MALESQLSAQVTRGGCGGDRTSAARRTKHPYLESGQKLKTRIAQHPARAHPQWSKDCCRASPLKALNIIQGFHLGHHPSCTCETFGGNSVPKPQTAWVLLFITHWAKVIANFFKATHAPGTSKESTTTQIGEELCHPLKWKTLSLSYKVISSGLAVVCETEYSTKVKS